MTVPPLNSPGVCRWQRGVVRERWNKFWKRQKQCAKRRDWHAVSREWCANRRNRLPFIGTAYLLGGPI